MKIGIDCSFVPGERTGVGEYAYNLVHALSRIDREDSYVLYPYFYSIIHPDFKNAALPVAKNFRVAFTEAPSELTRLMGIVRLAPFFTEEMLGDVDVVHSTAHYTPRLKDPKKSLVSTVHDLTVFTHPEFHMKLSVLQWRKGIRDAVRYADFIIAVSNHTKVDLMNHLDVPEERIAVTHLAADPGLKPVEDRKTLEAVSARYGLPRNYVLFVGALEPRKNVLTLLRAYHGLPERLKEEFHLVIAGARGWSNSEVRRTVRDLGMEERVRFAGYVDRADLGAVYSMAAVFVYPSLYEGFGLPILEAMACGAPVITSTSSSMPEVAGDAAMLFTPTDSEELRHALEKVLEESALREEMRMKGLRRAGKFSWERCARETLDVYRKAFEKRKKGDSHRRRSG